MTAEDIKKRKHENASSFCLFPELLPEGVSCADDAGEGYEQQSRPAVEGEIIAGFGIGVIHRGGGLEGALCFSVSELQGDGVLTQFQVLQEGLFQGDNGAAFLYGVVGSIRVLPST